MAVAEQFEALPWQEALWRPLGRWPQPGHAYLFHGPQGVGKRQLAERFRAFLLCSSPQGEACGQCRSCQLRLAGTHPDAYSLEPEEPGNWIRVDDLREALGFLALTSSFAPRKVLLIDPAEAMNSHAANALLKTLEEPPGDAVLLLVSHHSSDLPATIRSRCLQLACPLPNSEQSLAWLGTRLPELSVDQRQTLLTLAQGAPLRALQLEQQNALHHQQQWLENCEGLLSDRLGPMQMAENCKQIPLSLFFDWCCDWIQGVLRYRMTGQTGQLAASAQDRLIIRLAEQSPLPRVLALQSWLLAERQKLLARANLNPQLLLEALLVRWAQLIPKR